MRPIQALLFVLACVLLQCALQGEGGEGPRTLAALGGLSSLMGLATALDEASRRVP